MQYDKQKSNQDTSNVIPEVNQEVKSKNKHHKELKTFKAQTL